jgi:chromate transporter
MQTGRAELDLADSPAANRVSLSKLAFIFLKLGTIAFGGPAAHIAMMEDEFVRKRRWITPEGFLDRVAAASVIPGPSSTEVGIFIGWSLRGGLGLLVAGCCFIIPAAVLVTLIAAVYVRFGALPQVEGILRGIKPVVIAIILQAVWKLGRTAAKTPALVAIGLVAIALNLLGASPLAVLMFAGTCAGVDQWWRRRTTPVTLSVFGFLPLSAQKLSTMCLLALATATAVPIRLGRLFLSFLKIGSVVFGSGYVLLAFLRSEFVSHLHWLTEKQLIDAVAVGQFTPGPVFTTATFIGYVVAGLPGAVVATVGIFLPGFLLVTVSGPLLPKIRRSAVAGAVLDGVVVGSLGLMVVVAWELGKASVTGWLSCAILLVGLVAVFRFRINSAWLILGAGLVGWIAGR